MRISLIVAMSENRVIGRGGRLPWRLRADLRRFKRLTMGGLLIMGRKTFDSIGRPLPGRENLVISQRTGWTIPGVRVVGSLDEALQAAWRRDEVFVIGGASIYEMALPLADRLLITLVHAKIEGDTFFPRIDQDDWTLVQEQDWPADEHNSYAHTFRILQRKDDSPRVASSPAAAGALATRPGAHPTPPAAPSSPNADRGKRR